MAGWQRRSAAATRRRAPRAGRILVAAIVGLVPLAVAIPAAYAVVGLGVTVTFPTGVTVGQTNVPASLQITNNSTSPEDAGSLTLNLINLVPACGSTAPGPNDDCLAPNADPGVFQLSSFGFGEPATACAGQAFAISIVDFSTGQVSFHPAAPVVLAPPGSAGATCRIDFTFNVLKAPTKPAGTSPPNTVLTDQLGFAAGVSSVNGTSGAASGTSSVTVTKTGRTPGDYDGDGKTDVGVFRPTTGVWYVNLSGGGTRIVNWGSPGDIPVTGDYDGDGKTDLAVFRPSTGNWYIQLSGGGTKIVNWGAAGDVPVPGDYDGDGKTDIAVFRPSTGIWYISGTTSGTKIVNWGSANDIPVPGNYEGNGTTDLAVFRPSTGNWYISRNTGGTTIVNWGANGDTPVPGDYDHDGHTDIAVFRPSTAIWYVDGSTSGTKIVNWGSPGDVPVPGAYDGTGQTDLAVYRPSNSNWYIQPSGGGVTALNWGSPGDIPNGQPPSLGVGSTRPPSA